MAVSSSVDGISRRLAGSRALTAVALDWYAIALLAVINLACYHHVLSCGFFADDYYHLPYLSRVLSGHPELLLANFSSSWMQNLGVGLFYRPFLELTLLFDFWLWGADAWGFHLSNLLYQLGTSAFIFLFVKRLLRDCRESERYLVALFAASLFAAYPLHPEATTWILGRTDGFCTLLCVAALWLYVKSRQDGSRAAVFASFAVFALALLSKEMAVTVPPTILVYECMYRQRSGSLRARLRASFAAGRYFWLGAAAYLAIRRLALGTLVGGYVGSQGEILNESAFYRWIASGSLLVLLFPFSQAVISASNLLCKLIRVLYCLAGLLIIVSASRGRFPAAQMRHVCFAAVWLVITLAPTFQVFSLPADLTSSRVVYLPSVPLCILLVLLLFPFHKELPAKRWISLGQAAVLAGLVICLAAVTYKNNTAWAQAGVVLRQFRSSLEQRIKQLHGDQKLVIANAPTVYKGVLFFPNFNVLHEFLKPPVSPRDLSGRIASLEPTSYCEDRILNLSKLLRMAREPASYALTSWDEDRNALEPLDLGRQMERRQAGGQLPGFVVSPERAAGGKGLRYAIALPQELPPLAVDFVRVALPLPEDERARTDGSLWMWLFWDSAESGTFSRRRSVEFKLKTGGSQGVCMIPVSERKEWVTAGGIRHLSVMLPERIQGQPALRVALINGKYLLPQIVPDRRTLAEAADGPEVIRGPVAKFEYDCSMLAGARSAVAELTRPASSFYHYTSTYRDTELSPHSLRRINLARLKGTLSIPAGSLPQPGRYEIRVAGIDARARVTGYTSDPVQFRLPAPDPATPAF